MTNNEQIVRNSYRTLRELVQEALLRDIVRGNLKPGQRVVEAELEERYGVSRGPIREALRALEGQGLIQSRSNKGVFIASLSRAEIQEIYELRIELEGLAARFAATMSLTEQLAKMETLQEEMSKHIDDPHEWLTLNNEFHLTFYRASGRDRLCTYINDLMNAVEPYIHLYLDLPGQLISTHTEHGPLLAAARNGDGALCEEITQAHLRRAAEVIIEMADPNLLDPNAR